MVIDGINAYFTYGGDPNDGGINAGVLKEALAGGTPATLVNVTRPVKIAVNASDMF